MQALQVFSGFSVRDEAETKDFYNNMLGLRLLDEQMGLKFELPSGGTVFAYPKPNHEPASFTILNFIVEDIDAAVDELAAKGVVFERYKDMPAKQDDKGILRSNDTSMGPSIAWFKDPSGNILSIIQAAKPE